eukprot:TRINITY_DN39788_c0_g1_i1.p1 TRINITY_DN39788_c0_g1~~TRINITY_DN39788_c0_g1_i1.p1  ORF type:complete len:318 (-),score=50.74 TRINITY_DN39788_c0_g1_i1:165-1118(-)
MLLEDDAVNCGGCLSIRPLFSDLKRCRQKARPRQSDQCPVSTTQPAQGLHSSEEGPESASWTSLNDMQGGGGEVGLARPSGPLPLTAPHARPPRPLSASSRSRGKSVSSVNAAGARLLKALEYTAKGARRSAVTLRRAVTCEKQQRLMPAASASKALKASNSEADLDLGQRGLDEQLVEGTVVSQPEDGSCLFHSIAYGLRDGTSGDDLRKRVAEVIEDEPSLKIANTSVGEWVAMSAGKSTQAHARALYRGEVWGGGLELAVAAKIRRVNIHVYKQCPGGFRCITAFNEATAARTINVVYRTDPCRHYDALRLSEG